MGFKCDKRNPEGPLSPKLNREIAECIYNHLVKAASLDSKHLHDSIKQQALDRLNTAMLEFLQAAARGGIIFLRGIQTIEQFKAMGLEAKTIAYINTIRKRAFINECRRLNVDKRGMQIIANRELSAIDREMIDHRLIMDNIRFSIDQVDLYCAVMKSLSKLERIVFVCILHCYTIKDIAVFCKKSERHSRRLRNETAKKVKRIINDLT